MGSVGLEREGGPDGATARFEAMVPELLEPLRRYLARRTDPDTADDVLADTLLVCWRRLDDVPAASPLPWAYAVARRCLANAERSRRRQRRVAAKVAALDPPAEAVASTSGGSAELLEALAALRPAEAELVRLWAWERLTTAEIATVLELSPNAVSIRLHRAKAALRAELASSPGKNQPTGGHERAEGRQ